MTLKPKLYGLVGFPIKHSLSPCMHNAALKALKIKAKYKLFELSAGQLDSFFTGLKKNNICGVNVTIPYKEKVLAYLNARSFGVREIGAVNTVVVKNGSLKGFNTDFAGFSRHLKELKVNPRKVALLGAGGAAKAICFALGKKKGVEEVCIYDIDAFKSLSLVNHFQSIFLEIKFSAVARVEDLNLNAKDLLINASPVGMQPLDPCLIDERKLHKNIFVYDLIYNPAETKLLAAAKKMGVRYANGLGMLLYQGVLAFEHFTGHKAPVEVMRRALEKGCLASGQEMRRL